MALVTGKSERVNIPHEPGEWMEFRLLSGMELDEADLRATEKAMSLIKNIDPSILQNWKPDAERRNTANQYDKDTAIKYAVMGWSYPEPCSDATKQALDARTRDWAFDAIIGMNTRPLGE